MARYEKNSDRDYSKELKLNLDDALWDYTNLHNKEQIMSMFGLYAMRMGDINDDDSWVSDVDSVHDYNQNSYGYRDEEYSGTAELIATGCSQTFGQGIHKEGRWSTLLGKKLEMKTATLAVPGWGVQTAISATMHHIKRYGKPKVVVLLAPDFFRFDTMVNAKYCIGEGESHESGQPVRVTHTSRAEPNPSTPKYARKPFPIDKVLNAEAAFFASGQAIAHFSEYCREAGITFIWATWDFRMDYLVRHIKNLTISKRDQDQIDALGYTHNNLPYVNLDEYLDVGFFHHEGDTIEEFAALTCHKELRDAYGDCCFDRGTDKQDHMGVHMQAHLADKFYEKLSESLDI